MVRHLLHAVMVLAGVAFATPALAHASLVATDPANGALVDAAPAEVVFTFNEPVSPTVMRLIGPDGATVDLMAGTRTDGPAVVVEADFVRGTQLLSWRAVSEDGHPIGGTLTFSVGEASTGAPVIAETTDIPLDSAIWLVRVVLYLALFGGVAGAFFAGWIARGQAVPAAGAIRVLLFLGIAAAPVAFALQGADLLGAGLAGALDPAAWNAAADSSYAATLLVMFLAFVAALTSLGSNLARPLSLLAFIGIGAALALSGHASRAPVSLAWAAVLLHTVSVAFWTGALLPLNVLLRRPDDTATAVLARFSAAIPVALGGLLSGGILLVLVQVDAPSDLWTTAYGRILAAKLAAVAALFALAALNRLALTPRVRTNGADGARSLRRSIAVELVLVVAVLGLVAGWRFTPPPRSLAAAAAAEAPVTMELAGQNARATVTVTVTPGAPGPISAAIVLSGGDGTPLVPVEVAVSFANPAAGIEPIRQAAVRGEDGTWTVTGVFLPIAGAWEVAIDARVSAFDARSMVGRFVLGGAAAPAVPDGPAVAPPVTVAAITVSQAWTRKNPPGAPTGVAYLTITNAGPDEERLIAVSSPLAGSATLHETTYRGDVAVMTGLDAVVIPAGATIVLAPNGGHVMFEALAPDFATGETVPVTLVFATAGAVELSLAVFPVGSLGPGGVLGR